MLLPRTDSDFIEKHQKHGIVDGTTAVVAVVHGGKIIVANAGDSRAILIQRGGKVKCLSFDHKPSRWVTWHVQVLIHNG
jgi:serine/threonine protein phosphatase PrpC